MAAADWTSLAGAEDVLGLPAAYLDREERETVALAGGDQVVTHVTYKAVTLHPTRFN